MQRFISASLYLFAALNFVHFAFISDSFTSFQNLIYTRVTILFLTIYILLQIINRKFSVSRFLENLPDIFFIILGFVSVGDERIFQFYLLGRQSFGVLRRIIFGKLNSNVLEKLSENPPIFVLFSFIFSFSENLIFVWGISFFAPF